MNFLTNKKKCLRCRGASVSPKGREFGNRLIIIFFGPDSKKITVEMLKLKKMTNDKNQGPTSIQEGMRERLIIGMVIFPGLTQLDLTGPHEVFVRLPGVKVLLIAENSEPIRSDGGLVLTPDITFDDSPQTDILFVPGGTGVFDAMQNAKLINYLLQQAENAKYITSVCTGSLVLAATGLLNGYKATTHWLSLNLLKLFDIEVVEERVVIDRNRITSGGVTAGIDFGLYIAAKLFGQDVAKEVQLMMEYNPAPPYDAGSPKTAGKAIVDKVVNARKDIQKEREELIKKLLLYYAGNNTHAGL